MYVEGAKNEMEIGGDSEEGGERREESEDRLERIRIGNSWWR